MIGWLKIGAAIALFAVFTGGYVYVRHQNDVVSKLKADNTALAANLKAAQSAVRLETQVQTVTRTVYLKAKEGSAHVETIDPKCDNGAALVAGWRDGLDGVRNASQGGNSSSAVNP